MYFIAVFLCKLGFRAYRAASEIVSKTLLTGLCFLWRSLSRGLRAVDSRDWSLLEFRELD